MQIRLPGVPRNWRAHRQAADEDLVGSVRAALQRLPSSFERLVAIALLQNPEARGDFSYLLPSDYDREKIDLSLCREHHELFEEWLRLPLVDKLSDLEAYVADGRETVVHVISEWLSIGNRDRLIPHGVLPPEKRLFESDTDMLRIIWPENRAVRMLGHVRM